MFLKIPRTPEGKDKKLFMRVILSYGNRLVKKKIQYSVQKGRSIGPISALSAGLKQKGMQMLKGCF